MNNLLFKINVMLATFIFTFSVASCVQAVEFNYKKVDDQLKPYVDDYNVLLKYHCPKLVPTNNYSITIVNRFDKPDWIGLCTNKMNGYSIEILKSFWDDSNPVERRQLIYHELSHCILGLGHRDNDPSHYMYPQILYVPYETYLKQTMDDIEAYCRTL